MIKRILFGTEIGCPIRIFQKWRISVRKGLSAVIVVCLVNSFWRFCLLIPMGVVFVYCLLNVCLSSTKIEKIKSKVEVNVVSINTRKEENFMYVCTYSLPSFGSCASCTRLSLHYPKRNFFSPIFSIFGTLHRGSGFTFRM